MTDNRNTILAVILSGLVLIAWQYFYNVPQMERQRALQQTQTELAKPTPEATTRHRDARKPARQRRRSMRLRQISPPPRRPSLPAIPPSPPPRGSRSRRPA